MKNKVSKNVHTSANVNEEKTPFQPQSKLHCLEVVAPVRVNHAQMHARVHTHTPTSQTHDNECLERLW